MSATVTTTETMQTHPSPDVDKALRVGEFHYVPAGHVPKASPHNFHLPAMSEFGDVRFMPLHDMRPLPTVSELAAATRHPQLLTHGFTAVYHPTTLHSSPPYTPASWKDPALLKQHYIPETEAMLKAITGCTTVVTESLLLRSALWTESDALATHASHRADSADSADSESDGNRKNAALSDLETGFPQFIGFNASAGGASPAPKIHLDYAPAGARTHLRQYHPALTAAAASVIAAEDELLAQGKTPLKEHYHDSSSSSGQGGPRPRWALFSIWRPLRPVRRDPLALGDRRTFREADYVPVDVRTPSLGRTAGSKGLNREEEAETHETASYLARWSDGHEWYWVAEQKPEEVLVIGLFDSAQERDGGLASGGTLHSSVGLPGTEGEEPRESLELRCVCLW